jgi:hypothetical protein
VSRLAQNLRNVAKSALLALQPAAPYGAPQIDPAEELRGITIRWPAILQWPPAWKWVEPLFYGLSARVPVIVQDIPQDLHGTVVIEFCRGNRVFPVALNTSDYPDLINLGNERGTSHALRLEFKMQFRNGGYGIENIVPGGFVPDSVLADTLAAGPRRLRDRRQFAHDVYGRFGLEFATEIRQRAIDALRNQSRVQFYGGEIKVSYREFLKEIARSRVCIDLPGNGPFCFRLVDYLAVGACVICPPHPVTMPAPLIDRTHLVYTRPDMSNLVELCEYYVTNDEAREAVMSASREYYRKHLYWRSLSDYYLRTMLDRLPG